MARWWWGFYFYTKEKPSMIRKIIFILFLTTLGNHLSAETVAYKLKGDLKSNGVEATSILSNPLDFNSPFSL